MKTFTYFLLSLLCTLIFGISSVFAEQQTQPLVWFVHGMRVGNATFSESQVLLREIFPDAEEVVIKNWSAPKGSVITIEDYYLKSRILAEQFSHRLLADIEKLSPEDQHRLILVGHSLGGRIVVRTLAAGFRKERLQIRQMIIAGAATHVNDSDLPDAISTSRLTAYSLINPRDFTLTTAYRIAEKETALGMGTLYALNPERFYELCMENSTSHHAKDYFTFLLTCIQKDDFINRKVIVPQDVKLTEIAPVAAISLNWETEVSYGGWKLQKHSLRGHYRILTDKNIRVAEGRQSFMIPAFERVCQQLKQKEVLQHIAKNELPPDQKEMVNLNVFGSSGFWVDVRNTGGWRIQKSLCTEKYRFIDPYGFRYAIGDLQEVVNIYSQKMSAMR